MPLLVFEFLGTTELLVIALVALIIFGPRKLPEIGRTIGKGMAEFKRASEDFKRTWEYEVEVERRQPEPPAPEPPVARGQLPPEPERTTTIAEWRPPADDDAPAAETIPRDAPYTADVATGPTPHYDYDAAARPDGAAPPPPDAAAPERERV